MFFSYRPHILRTCAGLLLTTTLLSACSGSPVATPATTMPATTESSQATESPQTTSQPTSNGSAEDAVTEGIQKALDSYAEAYNKMDPEMLKQAVDQTNAPFRRLIQERLQTYSESFMAGQLKFGYEVKETKPREHGFVQARVEDINGQAYDWLFRDVKGQWVLSEPTVEQIGKREKVETDHFVFTVFPWTSDINQTLMELTEQAHEKVVKRLGKGPEKKPTVLIKPIFALPPPENPNALAYYDRSGNPRNPDRIVIFAPHTFMFGGYDPAVGWEGDLEQTLVHEYTHLVNNRAFTPIARMNDWMVEGLAEFVSDSSRKPQVSAAVKSGNIIPIIDPSGQTHKQDLEHLTILEKDVSLAYGLAYSLVAYTNEKHGGMEGFWKVVRAYDKLQNFDAALQEAYGISYEEFDKGWREWLEENY